MGPTNRILSRRSIALGLIGLGACSGQPDLVAGEQGRIARVPDGDALSFDTGLKVRLVEVEAPAPGYQDREGQPFAAEAREILVAGALGRDARLWYGGLSRDNYDRALAHVIASDETGADVWLNGYLVRQGAARVRTWPDNARRARKLLTFEEEARGEKRGLWSLDHWRVRRCDDLQDLPSLALVEGPLTAIDQTAADSAAHLSSAGIRLALSEKLGPPDTALNLAAGARLRLRCRIDARSDEPAIRITHWAQLETLPA